MLQTSPGLFCYRRSPRESGQEHAVLRLRPGRASLSPLVAKAGCGAGSLLHRHCGTEADAAQRQGCRVRVTFATGLPAGGGGGEEFSFLAHVSRGWVARPWCSGTTDLWEGPSARCWTTVRPQGTTTSSLEPGHASGGCAAGTQGLLNLSELLPGACHPEVPEPPPQVPASSRLGKGGISTSGSTRPCLPVVPVDVETSRLVPSMEAVFPAPGRAEMCCHGNCLANTLAGRGGKQQLRRLSE